VDDVDSVPADIAAQKEGAPEGGETPQRTSRDLEHGNSRLLEFRGAEATGAKGHHVGLEDALVEGEGGYGSLPLRAADPQFADQ
jgi:hypothetical protein